MTDLIEQKNEKRFQWKDGRLYFSKDTERQFFFSLTLIMVLVGIVHLIDVF